MKKSIIFIATAIACGISVNSKAQLANTKWAGVFNIPNPTDCTLSFKTDSAYLVYSGEDSMLLNGTADETKYVTGKDSFVIEVMSYKINGDTLIIQKINGGSPCGTEDVGKYEAAIKDNELSMTLINEDCDARSEAWPLGALKKVE